MDYHNFVLAKYYEAPTVDYREVLDSTLAAGEEIKPLVTDVVDLRHGYRNAGKDILFEGAQGALLDIDLGTYPFVTSSNTTAGGTAAGSGFGPSTSITFSESPRPTRHGWVLGRSDRALRRYGSPSCGEGPRVRRDDRKTAPVWLVRRRCPAAGDPDQQHIRPVPDQARCPRWS